MRRSNYYSKYDPDINKMAVGTAITVHAWGKFPDKTRTCIRIDRDETYNRNIFVFDDGIEWSEPDLRSNFALWESRNGYQITEVSA